MILAKHARRRGDRLRRQRGQDRAAQRDRCRPSDQLYQSTDFSKWAIERYGKPQRRTYEGGVDVVINFTGGDTWLPSLRCLKRGGKLLVCGATAGHDPRRICATSGASR